MTLPVRRSWFVWGAALWAALLLVLPYPARAHGDEPHGGAAAPTTRASASVASALSPAFEAVLVVPARAATAPLHGTLYLADFATNAPLAGAFLRLAVPGRRDTLRVQPTAEAGVYAVEGPALPAGPVSFALRVTVGPERGLLLLELPESAPAAAEAVGETAAQASADAPLPWTWFALVSALGLGGALWLARLARQRRRETAPSPVPAP